MHSEIEDFHIALIPAYVQLFAVSILKFSKKQDGFLYGIACIALFFGILQVFGFAVIAVLHLFGIV